MKISKTHHITQQGKVKRNPQKLTIEPTFVPSGSGNNPNAGKLDLHYKIKEWGYIFPSKKDALEYAKTHTEINGIIIENKK